MYADGSPYLLRAGDPVWHSEADTGSQQQTLIALGLWIPGLMIAGVLFAVGQPLLAFVAAGVVMAIHTALRPIVATYMLVLTIPAETLVTVLPTITTLPKLVALFAAIVSAPRLLRAITSQNRDSTAKWIIVMLAWASVSLFWAAYPSLGLIELQTLVLVWAIPLLIAVQIDDRRKWRLALVVFVVSCLLNSLAVVLTGADVGSVVEGKARGQVQALVGEVVTLEGNGPARLNATAIIACLMFFFTTTVTRKFISIGCIMLLVVAILLFMTRNVYVGLPLSLVAGMLVIRSPGMTRRALMFIGVGVVALICAVIAIKLGLIGEGIQHRFETTFEEGTRAGNRNLMWAGHMHHFFGSYLLGVGVGQASLTPEALYHVAHNDVIDLAGNLGIIGVIAYLGMHTGVFFRLRRIQDMWVGFFCAAAWAMLLFGGLTQTDYRGKFYTLVFALILAGIRVDERERAAASQPAWSYPVSSAQSPPLNPAATGERPCTSR